MLQTERGSATRPTPHTGKGPHLVRALFLDLTMWNLQAIEHRTGGTCPKPRGEGSQAGRTRGQDCLQTEQEGRWVARQGDWALWGRAPWLAPHRPGKGSAHTALHQGGPCCPTPCPPKGTLARSRLTSLPSIPGVRRQGPPPAPAPALRLLRLRGRGRGSGNPLTSPGRRAGPEGPTNKGPLELGPCRTPGS